VSRRFGDPVALSAEHDTAAFDCGVASLNTWLIRHALQAAAVGSARTFVIPDADQARRVAGYHALTVATVEHERATARARKGMPRHPIPAVLLARLAVDLSVAGRGLGAWLLRDAMLRTLSAADELGIRVLLVHAIDDQARAFYERFGFEPSPTDPLNLQLLIKDLQASIEAAG
jgi:GNAT superfamily N-acetyltransferase